MHSHEPAGHNVLLLILLPCFSTAPQMAAAAACRIVLSPALKKAHTHCRWRQRQRAGLWRHGGRPVRGRRRRGGAAAAAHHGFCAIQWPRHPKHRQRRVALGAARPRRHGETLVPSSCAAFPDSCLITTPPCRQQLEAAHMGCLKGMARCIARASVHEVAERSKQA